MLLDNTHEEVSVCDHEILHLEHTYETKIVELEERAEMIGDLEQQLLEL
jgi:hypothetical protein